MMALPPHLFDALMTAKIAIEDLIELERAGHPSGFKPGALAKQLAALDGAITDITKQESTTCP